MGISTFINHLTWGITYHNMLNKQHDLEKNIITWIHDYFNNYKEIAHTWPDTLTEKKWLAILYKPYIKQKKKTNCYIFNRHILNQCLVETPYLMTCTVIFLGIYYHNISITLAFSWLGVSQFMITASQGLSKNGEFKKLCISSQKKITSLLNDIKERASPTIQYATMILPSSYHIALHHNNHATFKLQPGIYPIIAPNGTGKSTLFDTIIAFDRLSTFNTHPAIIALKNNIPKNQMRIIYPQATIIEALGNLNNQISGPFKDPHENSFEILHKKLLLLLPHHIANQWLERLRILNTALNSREHKTLSAGERVILSCARCWFSWEPHIKLLLIDEGDTTLDQLNKKLLYDTLQYLKEKVSVLIISHDLPAELISSATLD